MPRKRDGSGRGPYKMVLVVRGELRLTAGKAAVQVAHGAVMLALEAEKRAPEAFRAWSEAGGMKIAVIAPTLDDLEALARKARALGIPSVFVEDAGYTEVPPGTKTVLGLGPSLSAELDAVTGELPLL
ncbi:MAG TPA: aminoacyl-tRNA hydrolase [Thermoplasmata archaeon]|nr:aminoacyl-tRNA hydrolase [Thermoplasmata archaeon]